MASIYRIRKEETAAGIRYLVDYRDSAGRRTKRRFKGLSEIKTLGVN